FVASLRISWLPADMRMTDDRGDLSDTGTDARREFTPIPMARQLGFSCVFCKPLILHPRSSILPDFHAPPHPRQPVSLSPRIASPRRVRGRICAGGDSGAGSGWLSGSEVRPR